MEFVGRKEEIERLDDLCRRRHGVLAQQAEADKWKGPVILDEFPFLVTSSPELPSVLQHWIDREAVHAGLVVAIAGSSQRMMHGLVLDSSAPLYGRAVEMIEV